MKRTRATGRTLAHTATATQTRTRRSTSAAVCNAARTPMETWGTRMIFFLVFERPVQSSVAWRSATECHRA